MPLSTRLATLRNNAQQRHWPGHNLTFPVRPQYVTRVTTYAHGLYNLERTNWEWSTSHQPPRLPYNMAMAAALPRELVDRTIDLSYDTQALLAWSEVDRSARERSQRKVFEAVYLNTVSRTIAFYTAIWREWFSRSSRLAGFVRELSFDVDFSRPGRTSEQAQWIMCNGSGAFNFLITTCTQLNALAIVSAPFFHFEIQDPMLYTGTLPSLKSLTLCGDGSGALDMLENMEDFLQGIISMTPMLRRVTLDGLCAGPRTILSGTNSATFPQITSLRVNFSPAAVELMRPISPSFEREIGRILGSMFPNAKDIVLKLQNQSDVGLARGILAQLGPKVEYLDLSLEGLTGE